MVPQQNYQYINKREHKITFTESSFGIEIVKRWKKSKIQSKILDSSPFQIFLPDPVKNPVSRKDFKSNSNPQSNPNVSLN